MKTKLRIVFMGTPSIATFVLQALLELPIEVVGVVTQPDKKVGRKQVVTASPVKKLALKNKLNILQPMHISQSKEQLQQLKPDAIITCAYGMFLPQSILDIPTIDAINVHASLLPAYRGGAPIHRCIMAGETKTGISIMQMIKKMDAGDVFVAEKVEIEANDTTSIVLDKLSKLSYTMIKEHLIGVLEGDYSTTTQDETQVSFAPIISRDDEHLDVSKCGNKIYNQLRALLDEPAGFVLINDVKVKLFDSTFFKEEHDYPRNTIIEFDNDMIIALKCGLLHVHQLQIPGKKKMAANQLKNGVGKTWIGKEIL
jgi:methionyl-tRNA formyltransferase